VHVVEGVGKEIRETIIDDHVFGISTVHIQPREFAPVAKVFLSREAVNTDAVCAIKPGHPDTIALFESIRPRASRVDQPDNLVTGDDRQLGNV
jgi:hypothetical protein